MPEVVIVKIYAKNRPFYNKKQSLKMNCTPKSGHGVKTRLELKDDFGTLPESSFLNPIDTSYCYSIPYSYQ